MSSNDSHAFFVFLNIVKVAQTNKTSLKEIKEQLSFNYKAITESIQIHKEHIKVTKKDGADPDPKKRNDSDILLQILPSGLNLYIQNTDI